MLQIDELTEPELLLSLAAITETACKIATRLRVIHSEELSSNEYIDLLNTEMTYFHKLENYYYYPIDLETNIEMQEMIRDYRHMHELY